MHKFKKNIACIYVWTVKNLEQIYQITNVHWSNSLLVETKYILLFKLLEINTCFVSLKFKYYRTSS